MDRQKIVVRFADGRLMKGHTTNFNPASDSFLLHAPDSKPGDPGNMVDLRDLKAVFFVKDFIGQRTHEDKKFFSPRSPNLGAKVRVTFADGEVVVGATPNYSPASLGFFIFPADADANTVKVFAVNHAIRNVAMMK